MNAHRVPPSRVLTLKVDADLCSPEVRSAATEAIERGGIVLLPDRGFILTPEERVLISDTRRFLGREPKQRNGRPTILFDRDRNSIIGSIALLDGLVRGHVQRRARPRLEGMMERFGLWADAMVQRLFPSYRSALAYDRITYRPIERSSKQPLHVDSSYGFPTQGSGMFRVFCNIDPAGRARIWQVGEPFETFAERYIRTLQLPPLDWRTKVINRVLPRRRRTDYDRLMAELRRIGKEDVDYQSTAPREILEFPSGSCWFALTDLTLHGAISGQHSLDQTYLLPAASLKHAERSSLHILERLTERSLR